MNASSFDSNPVLVSEARQRVRMKTGLKIHAAAFALVSAGMLAINLMTSPAVMWFWFPFLGWGLGLGSHAAVVGYLLSGRADQAVRNELALMQQRGR